MTSWLWPWLPRYKKWSQGWLQAIMLQIHSKELSFQHSAPSTCGLMLKSNKNQAGSNDNSGQKAGRSCFTKEEKPSVRGFQDNRTKYSTGGRASKEHVLVTFKGWNRCKVIAPLLLLEKILPSSLSSSVIHVAMKTNRQRATILKQVLFVFAMHVLNIATTARIVM